MKRALHLGLPRKGVDDFVEMKGCLHAGQRLAQGIGQLKVGDQPEGVSHRNDPLLQLHPVPGNTSGGLGGWVAPDRLSAAGVIRVTRT